MRHLEIVAQFLQERPLGCFNISVQNARRNCKLQRILPLLEGDCGPVIYLGEIDVHHLGRLPESRNFFFRHPVELRVLGDNHRLYQFRLSLPNLFGSASAIFDLLENFEPIFHALQVLLVKTEEGLQILQHSVCGLRRGVFHVAQHSLDALQILFFAHICIPFWRNLFQYPLDEWGRGRRGWGVRRGSSLHRRRILHCGRCLGETPDFLNHFRQDRCFNDRRSGRRALSLKLLTQEILGLLQISFSSLAQNSLDCSTYKSHRGNTAQYIGRCLFQIPHATHLPKFSLRLGSFAFWKLFRECLLLCGCCLCDNLAVLNAAVCIIRNRDRQMGFMFLRRQRRTLEVTQKKSGSSKNNFYDPAKSIWLLIITRTFHLLVFLTDDTRGLRRQLKRLETLKLCLVEKGGFYSGHSS
mmetsp:Transcript_985/g.1811  ORF Transcript_985/g.1811 Transcript_985/m.1811 type:complete len:411 (-) Transcript_985:153-1385(-)